MRRGTLGAADCLCLAATPVFAIMASLTAIHGGGPADALCSAAGSGSPLGGMVPMYLLMSAVHSAPWLRLIASHALEPSPAPPVAADRETQERPPVALDRARSTI